MTNDTSNIHTAEHTTDSSTEMETLVAMPGTSSDARRLSREEFEALEPSDRLKVVLLGEQLDVQKVVRQMGEVTITKRIVEETVQVPVTIRREEVILTRSDISVPLNANEQIGASAQAISEGSSGAFQEQTFKIVLHEEVPHVTKTTRVSGEVEVSKRLLTEEKTITDTVRHEEADINAPETVTILNSDAPR
jgi:uncharacterized protein (TIGR02271 family)